MQHSEHPKPSPSRPSLLSHSGVGDTDHTRILGTVQGRSAVASKPRKKWLALLFLGLGVLAIAWGLLNRPSQTPTATASAASSTTDVPPLAPAAPAAVVASEVIAPAEVASAAPMAATITDAAPSPEPNSKNDDTTALSTALEAGVVVPPDTLKSALIAKPAPPPTAKPKTTTARSEPVKATPERKKSNAPTVTEKTASSDHDVDLISALMAHTSGHSDTKSAQRTQKPVASKGNQDVVERRRGDSTASLLKRCKRLGGTEAKLCSRRICASHENEAACRAK